MKFFAFLLLTLPLLLFAQPVLRPHIGVSAPPQSSDVICSIPVYNGTMEASGYAEGDTASDFTLYKPNGDSVRLRDLLLNGKPVLLVGANYTCPVWRGKIDVLNQIATYYGSQLQVFVVYTVEAHPKAPDVSPYSGQVWTTSANQTEGVLYRQPTTFGERLALIDTMKMHYNIVPEILVDGPCNDWWSHYGPAPNNAYLIETNGRINTKHGWFSKTPLNMWCDIDSLLATASGNCINAGNNGFFAVMVDNGDSVVYGYPGDILAVHTTIQNLSSTENVELSITKQQVVIPAAWETALCVDICYASNVNATTVTIPPQGLQPFIFYFFSSQAADTGRARVRIANLNNTGNRVDLRLMGITQTGSSVAGVAKGDCLSVYPNPFKSGLQLQIENLDSGESAVEVFDVMGKKIFNGRFTSKRMTIPGNSFLPGVYFVKVGNTVKRVVKE